MVWCGVVRGVVCAVWCGQCTSKPKDHTEKDVEVEVGVIENGVKEGTKFGGKKREEKPRGKSNESRTHDTDDAHNKLPTK